MSGTCVVCMLSVRDLWPAIYIATGSNGAAPLVKAGLNGLRQKGDTIAGFSVTSFDELRGLFDEATVLGGLRTQGRLPPRSTQASFAGIVGWFDTFDIHEHSQMLAMVLQRFVPPDGLSASAKGSTQTQLVYRFINRFHQPERPRGGDDSVAASRPGPNHHLFSAHQVACRTFDLRRRMIDQGLQASLEWSRDLLEPAEIPVCSQLDAAHLTVNRVRQLPRQHARRSPVPESELRLGGGRDGLQPRFALGVFCGRFVEVLAGRRQELELLDGTRRQWLSRMARRTAGLSAASYPAFRQLGIRVSKARRRRGTSGTSTGRVQIVFQRSRRRFEIVASPRIVINHRVKLRPEVARQPERSLGGDGQSRRSVPDVLATGDRGRYDLGITAPPERKRFLLDTPALAVRRRFLVASRRHDRAAADSLGRPGRSLSGRRPRAAACQVVLIPAHVRSRSRSTDRPGWFVTTASRANRFETIRCGVAAQILRIRAVPSTLVLELTPSFPRSARPFCRPDSPTIFYRIAA